MKNQVSIYQDSQGYIIAEIDGKPRQIEHFSNKPTVEKTRKLYLRVHHLLTLGVHVNTGSVIWFWSWFEHMTPDNPYLPLLKCKPLIYHNPQTDQVLIGHRDHQTTLLIFKNGKAVKFISWDDELYWLESGGSTLYHFLQDMGFGIPDMHQGEHRGICYATGANVIEFLKEHGIKPDVQL